MRVFATTILGKDDRHRPLHGGGQNLQPIQEMDSISYVVQNFQPIGFPTRVS